MAKVTIQEMIRLEKTNRKQLKFILPPFDPQADDADGGAYHVEGDEGIII